VNFTLTCPTRSPVRTIFSSFNTKRVYKLWCVVVNWIHLAQIRVHRQTHMNGINKGVVSFWDMTPHHWIIVSPRF